MIQDHPFTAQAMINRDWRIVANEASFDAAKREAIRAARLPARIVHRDATIWERWAQSGEWYAPGFEKFKDAAV